MFAAHRLTAQADETAVPAARESVSLMDRRANGVEIMYVAAALIPAGNAVTKSVSRTPTGES